MYICTYIRFIYFFQYGVAGDYYFFAYSYMVRADLTECIHETISLKSIYPQTRQFNFMTRNTIINLAGELTGEKPFNEYVL